MQVQARHPRRYDKWRRSMSSLRALELFESAAKSGRDAIMALHCGAVAGRYIAMLKRDLAKIAPRGPGQAALHLESAGAAITKTTRWSLAGSWTRIATAVSGQRGSVGVPAYVMPTAQQVQRG